MDAPGPGARAGETTQLVSKYCGAKMPATPFWDGGSLPGTSEGQIYLIYEDLQRPGEWVAALVDYGSGKIPFGVRTKTSGLGGLFATLGKAAQYAGGRQPNPPPPVGDDALPAALLEWGRLAASMPGRAEEAAASCVN